MINDTLNCNGKILDLSQCRVMGIINLSKDSFYCESIATDIDRLHAKVDKMISEGVDLVDLGAASSRPGSTPLSAEEEWAILEPVLNSLRDKYPELFISVDTYHGLVADRCYDFKVNMINDISGFQDNEDLLDVLSEKSMAYVLMHKKGNTLDMQDNPTYDNVCLEVLSYLKNKLHILKSKGIHDVVIDPGFGFGKSQSHNYQLLRKMEVFKILDVPILAGVSRKSMIYKSLDITAAQSLNGTTALHMLALQNGAKILRVHDVREAKECIDLYQCYLNA